MRKNHKIFYKIFILEHTTKHCTKLIRNDMAKITMNEEIPQVIRFENHKMFSKIKNYFKDSEEKLSS